MANDLVPAQSSTLVRLAMKWDNECGKPLCDALSYWSAGRAAPIGVVRQASFQVQAMKKASRRASDVAELDDLEDRLDMLAAKYARENPMTHKVPPQSAAFVEKLMSWHAGQGDAVYAVASSWHAGKPVDVEIVERASVSIARARRGLTSKKDIAELDRIEKRLDGLVAKHGPRENPAKKTSGKAKKAAAPKKPRAPKKAASKKAPAQTQAAPPATQSADTDHGMVPVFAFDGETGSEKHIGFARTTSEANKLVAGSGAKWWGDVGKMVNRGVRIYVAPVADTKTAYDLAVYALEQGGLSSRANPVRTKAGRVLVAKGSKEMASKLLLARKRMLALGLTPPESVKTGKRTRLTYESAQQILHKPARKNPAPKRIQQIDDFFEAEFA